MTTDNPQFATRRAGTITSHTHISSLWKRLIATTRVNRVIECNTRNDVRTLGLLYKECSCACTWTSSTIRHQMETMNPLIASYRIPAINNYTCRHFVRAGHFTDRARVFLGSFLGHHSSRSLDFDTAAITHTILQQFTDGAALNEWWLGCCVYW